MSVNKTSSDKATFKLHFTAASLAGLLAFSSSVYAAGTWFARLTPLAPSAPLSPSESDECASFSSEWRSVIAEVSQQHDDCLAGQSGSTMAGPTCTNIACQYLHNMRDDYQRRSSNEVAACNMSVVAAQRRQNIINLERQETYARDEARRSADQARLASERSSAASQLENSRIRRTAEIALEKARESEARWTAAKRAVYYAKTAAGLFPNSRVDKATKEDWRSLSLASLSGLSKLSQEKMGEAAESAISTEIGKRFGGKPNEKVHSLTQQSKKLVSNAQLPPISQRATEIAVAATGNAAAQSMGSLEDSLANLQGSREGIGRESRIAAAFARIGNPAPSLASESAAREIYNRPNTDRPSRGIIMPTDDKHASIGTNSFTRDETTSFDNTKSRCRKNRRGKCSPRAR